jgi:hypothetical protein
MVKELEFKRVGNALRYASPQEGIPSGTYQVRIPQGAQSWHLVTQTGSLPVPCSVVMSMDAPPDATRAVDVGPDFRNVLQRLWEGQTLRSETPAQSGVLSVSQPEMGGAWRADRERWVYLQFDFGPYLCRSMQSQIDMPADAAPAPAPAPTPTPLPEPSLALAGRTLSLAHQAGLVRALMLTAGARNDDELVAWMQRQGDLWFSLCRMVGLAEGGKA